MKLNQINIRQLKVASVNYTVVVVTDEVAEWLPVTSRKKVLKSETLIFLLFFSKQILCR